MHLVVRSCAQIQQTATLDTLSLGPKCKTALRNEREPQKVLLKCHETLIRLNYYSNVVSKMFKIDYFIFKYLLPSKMAVLTKICLMVIHF
jgi:hypothetical protein